MKRYNKIIFAVCALPFAGIISCTERIDVKTDDAPPRVVINGSITTDTVQHSVRISRSAGYFTDGSPEAVSRATVTVSVSDGNVFTLAENDTVPGLYQTAPDVYGEEGKTYTLDVFIDFDASEHYQATAHLNRGIRIDSIRLQPSPLSFHDMLMVETLLYAHDLPGENYYRIFTAINDTVLNPTIDRYRVIDNAMFNGDYINGVAITYLNQRPHRDGDDHNRAPRSEVLQIGDVVTLTINTISKEYADFISQAQTELSGSIPIFGGPPANVTTNIRSMEGRTVSGFFAAFANSSANVTVMEEFNTK